MSNAIVIGAGIAGATAARLLANNKVNVTVIEKSDNIGGACGDVFSKKDNCFIHKFGPHIFHTSDKDVWDFVNKFSNFVSYQHKVFTYVDKKYYSFPINLNVLSQLFNTKVYSMEHAESLIDIIKFNNPKTFEEAALNSVGKTIYEKFVKNYTEKQWKMSCDKLSPDIFKRVNIRFNYNDRLF